MRKKSIFLVILAFATLSLTGQNLVKADYKPIHFGFTLGINAMDFGITPSLIPASDGRIYKADVEAITPGFSVGVIGNLRLSEYFALRLVHKCTKDADGVHKKNESYNIVGVVVRIALE